MTLPPPAHIHQLDGSAWQGSACMGAAGAMALDAYSAGSIRVGQAAIRANQDDQTGGIGLDDVATAWQRGWGQRLTQGSRSWSTVRARLLKGDGAIVAVNYGAMGSSRAPGSTFVGAHALYVQRLYVRGTRAASIMAVVNDPLRRAAIEIPEGVLSTAYTGSAGWGSGTYGQAATGATDGLGAFYSPKTGRPIVTYPRGYTKWTADELVRQLHAADFFGSLFPLAAGGSEDIARGIFRADQGRPWNEALHAEWARELKAAAVQAASGPLATAGMIAAGASPELAALGELPMRAGVVAAIVGLGLLGVWLTFREPLSVVLPPPVRRLARAR